MRNKSEVFSKIKEFEAMEANEIGKRIKKLQSDKGGEYTSRDFDEYLKIKDIQRQFSVPRTPEHISNGMNRTIEEIAKAMINGAGLSVTFW